MKSALISPNEPVETGYRVAEVSENQFEVAQPMFWTACDNNVQADQFWYDPSDMSIKPISIQIIDLVQPAVIGAQIL